MIKGTELRLVVEGLEGSERLVGVPADLMLP